MDIACIIITALGILVTVYSIIITRAYSGLKKQTSVQVGGGQQQAGGGQQQAAGQQQVVEQTAGNVTTINNYGTLNYNTNTKGTQNGGNN